MNQNNLQVYKVVFLRHGESDSNKENTWGSWTDVDLSDEGIRDGEIAGNLLKNWKFDVCFTSVLKRTIKTWNIVADITDQHFVPVRKSWRLNEKHYGVLMGMNKSEIALKYGEEQVKKWRRDYHSKPPELYQNDPRNPAFDEMYKSIPRECLPLSESLKENIDRVLIYWYDYIVPEIKLGKNVILCVHGNTIRAILKVVENISNQDILELNIPNGFPLVCEFDKTMKFLRKYYLGDEEEISIKIKAVENQGKIKKI